MNGEGSGNKPWGSRFTEPTDAFVERFTASVGFDQRLADHDIQGSIAHAQMLGKIGVISEAERDAIVAGLETIRADIGSGAWVWSEALEDAAAAHQGQPHIVRGPRRRSHGRSREGPS